MQIKSIIEKPKNMSLKLNPIWFKFIRYCEKLGFGKLQKVQIQNGIPVSAEVATKRIKFS